MNFHDKLRQTMIKDKAKIGLFQWATTAAISSLVYSEYIRRFRRKLQYNRNPPDGKLNPIQRVDVPPIHYVQSMLDPGEQWMTRISNELIDGIIDHDLIQKYGLQVPELSIFQDDNLEILRCIFDANIIPFVARQIPSSIAQKFGLNNPDDKAPNLFYENREIDLFDRQPLSDQQMKYLIHETVLHMMMPIPSIDKMEEEPMDYSKIPVTRGTILSVDHKNAICPIHINEDILELDKVMKLISFVTSTYFSTQTGENVELAATHHGNIIHTLATSSPYNHVRLTWILGTREVQDERRYDKKEEEQ